jgi:hypothetical protein
MPPGSPQPSTQVVENVDLVLTDPTLDRTLDSASTFQRRGAAASDPLARRGRDQPLWVGDSVIAR